MTLTSTILPMFVMLIKIVQVLMWYTCSYASRKPKNPGKNAIFAKTIDKESGDTPDVTSSLDY
jgi:uncharacterized membrane protein